MNDIERKQIMMQFKHDYNVDPKNRISNSEVDKKIKEIYTNSFGHGDPTIELTFEEELNFFDIIVGQKIVKMLNAIDAKLIIDNTIFCIVKHGFINASTRKQNNNYIVLLNSGLISYINMYLKYTFASIDPKSVSFLGNLNNLEKLDFNFYQNCINSMTNYYLAKGVPFAIEIILKKSEIEPLRLCHMKILIFVIAHEIAHILLGHLDDQKDQIINNKAVEYNNELLADIFAFDILQRVTNQFYKINKYYEAHNLECVLLLFDIFARINKNCVSGFPAAKDRFINIHEKFFARKDPVGFDGAKIIQNFNNI